MVPVPEFPSTAGRHSNRIFRVMYLPTFRLGGYNEADELSLIGKDMVTVNN